MFSKCNTLAELNAERARLSLTMPLTEINAAYNLRRNEILSSRVDYIKLTPIIVTPEQPVKYAGIPIAGRSNKKNTIELTKEGFLF